MGACWARYALMQSTVKLVPGNAGLPRYKELARLSPRFALANTDPFAVVTGRPMETNAKQRALVLPSIITENARRRKSWRGNRPE